MIYIILWLKQKYSGNDDQQKYQWHLFKTDKLPDKLKWLEKMLTNNFFLVIKYLLVMLPSFLFLILLYQLVIPDF